MMKKEKFLKQMKSGQALPLVVMMMFLILAMVALVLDGGSLMLNRRSAQVAADAAALAGADQLCKGGNSAAAVAAAASYAAANNATSATPQVITTQVQGVNTTVVQVNTTVSNGSFFAKIFGVDKLNSAAVAQAGCFSPSTANGVLPVSWACKAPVVGSDSPDCEIMALDWETEMKPLVTGSPNPVNIHGIGNVTTPMDFEKHALGKYLYIIVDSQKTSDDISSTCAPTGSMICDINGDGINDAFGGGDRSWLDLNGGGGGASSLRNWIEHGYSGNISIHTWLGGQSGVETSVYHSVQNVIDRYPPTYPVVLLPVFDGICDANPEGKLICETTLHDPIPPEEQVIPSSGAANYFHISGFSAFYLTCVDDGGGANKCPGAKLFLDKNPSLKKLKTIEGYFVKDYPFNLGNPGTGGDDLGIYIISLTK